MENALALTPPMGWNSWDCYGASVTEAEVKGNAEYMARHLLPFGWEYVVVDIQWYEPETNSSIYRPFAQLVMDEHARLLPAPNRFPSAAHGQGFTPLAAYVHALGLKFGIHILRGIPRQAVHANMPLLNTARRAREIAHPSSFCPWNTDMYGIDASKEGAQEYYDSLFQLYASWGVDLVKVDDMSYPYSTGEIELVRQAIDRCGRPMVLSLSPGPTPLERAEHVKQHANMWRLTGDFWDRWDDLYAAFETCHRWSSHAGPGHWPDADMLPLGHIALRSYEHNVGDRWTRFTHDEQVLMLTLWCMARSPLMVGGELRDNDAWTLSLLTNPEVLLVLRHSRDNHQLARDEKHILWTARDEDGGHYLAVFNMHTDETSLEIPLSMLGVEGNVQVRDLWQQADIGMVSSSIQLGVPAHGARLIRTIEK